MANCKAEIEYRVRPVTRYIVTKFERGVPTSVAGSVTSRSTGRGEYDSARVAYEVAYALCKSDHARLGYPPDDERIQYPLHPDHENARPAE